MIYSEKRVDKVPKNARLIIIIIGELNAKVAKEVCHDDEWQWYKSIWFKVIK